MTFGPEFGIMLGFPGSNYFKVFNRMPIVRVKENEPFDVAMRRFRRTVERTGLIQELKSRMAYEKPTTERKRKKAAAVARLRKQIRRAQLPKVQAG